MLAEDGLRSEKQKNRKSKTFLHNSYVKLTEILLYNKASESKNLKISALD
jgi:hypothetical protein